MTPPFRADHVGSLLRPASLASARADFKSGRIDGDALRAAEDEAIRGVIAMQKEVGLHTVTDGELRRTAWHMDFIHRLGGIGQGKPDSLRFRDAHHELEYRPPLAIVSAPTTLERPIFSEAFAFLRDAALEDQTPKLTIPSPSMVHTAVATPSSTRRYTRIWTNSGPISPPPIANRSVASTSSAVVICSSTM